MQCRRQPPLQAKGSFKGTTGTGDASERALGSERWPWHKNERQNKIVLTHKGVAFRLRVLTCADQVALYSQGRNTASQKLPFETCGRF